MPADVVGSKAQYAQSDSSGRTRIVQKGSGYDVASVTDGHPSTPADGAAPNPRGRARVLLAIAVVALVVVAASVAVYRDRHSFSKAIHVAGPWPVLGALLCGLIGTGATFPMWRSVLGGLGVHIPWGSGARIFFISQLGKYVPGSVWPVVMQMEAGRSRGASRRTMLAANLTTIAINSSTGLILACILLPTYNSAALHRYRLALIALPFLLALLHPRAITGILDRVLGLLRRPPLGVELRPAATVRAAGWSLLSWAGFGAHLSILAIAVGPDRLSTWVLSTGALALAIPVGVLFIPAPAGAGVRDVVLTLVLGSIVSSGVALEIALMSRVVLIACDLLLAAVAAAWPGRHRPVGAGVAAPRPVGGAG